MALFTSKVDALKVISPESTWFVADQDSLTAAEVGEGNFLLDPTTGKSYTVTGGNYAETTETLPAGATTDSTLRWSGTAWVENTALLATAAGVVTADTSVTAGEAGTATGAFILKGTTSGTGTISTDATVTKITSDKPLEVTGAVTASTNVTATAGAVLAGTTVTGTTGVIATTGDVVATAGDVTAGGGDVNIASAAANTLSFTGGTNDSISMAGSGTKSIATSGGTTGIIDMAGSGTQELQMSGTTNTIDLNGTGAQSVELAGTSNAVLLTGSTTQDITFSGGTNSSITMGGSGTATITLSASGTKSVTGLSTPTNATDAANKAYVDALSAGLSVKTPTKYATTAALNDTPSYSNGASGVGATLTGATNNVALVVDGYTFLAGDVSASTKILVKDQASALQNGVYSFTQLQTAGLPYVITRVTPYDEASEITDGSFFFNTAGATNADKGYVQTNVVTTIGTDAIAFNQFSSAGGGVTSVPTESGTATPSSGVLTITGSPSIDTSASGSTVTVALAADLDTGATGFTVTNRRIPFASATDTLGDSAKFVFDNANSVLNVGTDALGGVILGVTTAGVYATQGTDAPYNGVMLPTNTNSAGNYFSSGNVSGTGISGSASVKSGNSVSGNTGTLSLLSGTVATAGNSGLVQISSGNSSTSGNSGNISISSGNAASGNSGYVSIASGSASGTRGTITLSAAANDTKLTNSPTTDTVTGTNLPNVADVSFIREKVILRKTGTSSVVLTAGLSTKAAKFIVYVQESATVKYASEIMVVSTNATTGVDSTEYAIIGTGTLPAGLAITPAVVDTGGGVYAVQLTVAQTGGVIVVEAIPLV